MADDWEDWESEDFIVPDLKPPTEEQLKALRERQLVEESDNALAKDLFSTEEDLVFKEMQTNKKEENFIIKPKKIKTVSKKEENELKQKENSKKLREKKLIEQRNRELYGETEEDEYDTYADKFY